MKSFGSKFSLAQFQIHGIKPPTNGSNSSNLAQKTSKFSVLIGLGSSRLFRHSGHHQLAAQLQTSKLKFPTVPKLKFPQPKKKQPNLATK
jgi:hypothetical protein